MNIYLVERINNEGLKCCWFDAFDAAVVVAPNESEAKVVADNHCGFLRAISFENDWECIENEYLKIEQLEKQQEEHYDERVEEQIKEIEEQIKKYDVYKEVLSDSDKNKTYEDIINSKFLRVTFISSAPDTTDKYTYPNSIILDRYHAG